MKVVASILFSTLLTVFSVQAQNNQDTKKVVDDINRALDRAVVNQDVVTLQKYYGDDFYFKHATGQVDSKETWINSIRNLKEGDRYISREHDSTEVEVHGDIAIIAGKLSVARDAKPQVRKYYLRYIRVFARRDNVWQLISHRTTKEWH